MTVAELIIKLQTLPQDIPVTVYEAAPDDYVPVVEVQHCAKDFEPHVRLLSGMEED
jgi:hypothetical protein